MKTTATNKKIRILLTDLRDGKLIPRPDFQRRLVWTNNDKCSFLETVFLKYPFPEIYIAAGDVNVETGEATELLVDGQQRITTLYQYFIGSNELTLKGDLIPYADLSDQQKEEFLQYDVVVRDLGHVELEVIRDVFYRINSTSYSLNAMEIANARYDGAFKTFGEIYSQKPFFENHRVFSAGEIRRMQDIRFALLLSSTAMGTYFNRDTDLEEYLSRYNDEFSMESDLEKELDWVLDLIDRLNLPNTSRIWKKADLFTIIIELHTARFKLNLEIDPESLSSNLTDFYDEVNSKDIKSEEDDFATNYYKAALQATNDRGSRITRGEIIQSIIQNSLA